MTGKKNYHQGESYVAVVYHDAYSFLLLISILRIDKQNTHLWYEHIICTYAMRIKTTQIGHDIKSLLLNLATFLLFMLPFALYYGEEGKEKLYCGVVVASMVVAIIAPPFGWMRPHPYTDMPGNEPLRFRKEN